MKQNNSEFTLIVIIIIIFCASFGILHGKKNKLQNYSDENANLSSDEIINFVQPLIQSKSIDSLSTALTQFKPMTIYEVMQKLCDDITLSFDASELVELLCKVISKLSLDEQHEDLFFNLFLTSPVFHRVPILLLMTKAHCGHLISNIIDWLHRTDRDNVIKEWTQQLFTSAIENNDYEALKSPDLQYITVVPEQLSSLLCALVEKNKSPLFIPILVRDFHAHINYVDENKKTPLMYAVASNNIPMAKILLEMGADRNLITDPVLGNAMQIAYEHGYGELEQILRDYIPEQ